MTTAKAVMYNDGTLCNRKELSSSRMRPTVGKKSKKKATTKGISDSAVKGKLVEIIVASMHESEAVNVQRNVFLPAQGSVTKRTREIDVLLTKHVEGNPTYIVFECKNYKDVIDVPKIDEFFGKLHDIGIPTEQGIYVSVNGFTPGALERAQKAGITPLILTGLTQDRLTAAVQKAFQSVIYLLADVVNMAVEATTLVGTRTAGEMLFFYNSEGQLRGSVLDLIWKDWREGNPPSTIGEHKIELTMPADWRLRIDGKLEPVVSVSATIRILGLMITITGQVNQHTLINPLDNTVDRYRARATFDTSPRTYPLLWFESEAEVAQFLQERPEALRLAIGRFRLPRIRLNPLYWPPSERVSRILGAIVRAHQAGELPDFQWSDLAGIEGEDLHTIWEPLWAGHPMVQEMATK
jgi:restriction endonuclease